MIGLRVPCPVGWGLRVALRLSLAVVKEAQVIAWEGLGAGRVTEEMLDEIDAVIRAGGGFE